MCSCVSVDVLFVGEEAFLGDEAWFRHSTSLERGYLASCTCILYMQNSILKLVLVSFVGRLVYLNGGVCSCVSLTVSFRVKTL